MKTHPINFVNRHRPELTIAAPRKLKTLQVVLKIAEQCNLACTYCYYYFLGDDSALGRDPLIKKDLFQPLAEFFAQGSLELELESIVFVFHGGEPMLLKPERFAELCDAFQKTLSPVVKVGFAIQTNGTIWSNAWLQVFQKYQVTIGISIDGPKEYQDKYRLDKNSHGSYEAVARTLLGLRRMHADRMVNIASTITVVKEEFDPGKVMRHLFSEFAIRDMGFLLPDISCDRGLLVGSEAEKVGRQLCSLYDAWVELHHENINVREVSQVVDFFQVIQSNSTQAEATQYIADRAFQKEIIVVQSTGHLAVDDSLMAALTWRQMTPSPHFTQVTLREFVNSESLREIELAHETLPTACEPCEWKALCRGGSPANRFSKSDGFNNPSAYCNAYKIYFRHVCNHLLVGGYPIDLLHEKLGYNSFNMSKDSEDRVLLPTP